MHQLEGAVDLVQAHGVGDEGIQGNLALLRFLHIARQLAAPFHAAEGAAAPHPSGDQLERAGADLGAGRRHADDGRLAPALVAALQRRTHQLHVADALKGIIDAAIGHLDDHLLNRLGVVLRVDEVGGAQFTRHVELGRVDIDGNDSRGLGHLGADDGCQADTAQAEDRHRGALADLGGVEHRADAGGHTTAEQTDLLQRCFLGNLRQGDFRQHRVLGKGRTAHVVIDRLALVGEARGAIGHQALALGGAHRLAQVGLARSAEFALAAFGRVQRDHVITDRQRGHPLAHRLDDATSLMTKDARKHPLAVLTGQGVGVGVAHTAGDDTHQYLASPGWRHVDLDDLQRLVGGKGHGGTGFDHGKGSCRRSEVTPV